MPLWLIKCEIPQSGKKNIAFSIYFYTIMSGT